MVVGSGQSHPCGAGSDTGRAQDKSTPVSDTGATGSDRQRQSGVSAGPAVPSVGRDLRARREEPAGPGRWSCGFNP